MLRSVGLHVFKFINSSNVNTEKHTLQAHTLGNSPSGEKILELIPGMVNAQVLKLKVPRLENPKGSQQLLEPVARIFMMKQLH